MVRAPSALCIGWWPLGDRSMMLSLRWPRSTGGALPSHRPRSSGPRGRMASSMASNCAARPPPTIPAIPHMLHVPESIRVATAAAPTSNRHHGRHHLAEHGEPGEQTRQPHEPLVHLQLVLELLEVETLDDRTL